MMMVLSKIKCCFIEINRVGRIFHKVIVDSWFYVIEKIVNLP